MVILRVKDITLECVQGDITDQADMEAIVNAANARLLPGGGVAGAIHRAAGPGLEKECRPLAPVHPGEAVITGAHNLPNKHVIHCLGPVYGKDEPADVFLADCYRNTLRGAEEHGIRSIAFPAVSTGIFGYPVEEAAQIVLKTVVETLPELSSVRHIRFVLFSKADLDLYERLLGETKTKKHPLLIDLDGVLYVGDKAIPGAAEAVQWLDKENIPYLFVTNTSSRPRSALVEKLARFGIFTDEKAIFSPPVAASQWLKAHAPGPAALFVPQPTKAEFNCLEELKTDATSGASSVVIGDLGAQWTFQVLNRAFRL
ncbi:MAG: macro domain-containing protein, partial [Chlorobiales bacterium]|nr:macro domain-containing protein [Chlorobiales bacterium]